MQSTTSIRQFLLFTYGKWGLGCPHSRLTPELTSTYRYFSSKTPPKSNLGVGAVPSAAESPRGANPYPYEYPANQKVTLVSPQTVRPQLSSTPAPRKFQRKRKEILRMDEKELEGYAILVPKPPLLDTRGEANSFWVRALGDTTKRNNMDWLAFFAGNYDFRPVALKRWKKSIDVEVELKRQAYNPERSKVLGHDLAVAHFIVFRKGRIRFMNHTEWVTEYRKDAKPGVVEEDLPIMRFDLCTMPVKFDPRFRVEAIDCQGMGLRYEGLANFENLNYVKWLSFKDTPHIDDWCLDRITRIFNETLEYIDLSGCKQVSERGIGALAKCRNLKKLVVADMPHCKHLEMVAAMLEDQLPELAVEGIDYVQKMQQIKTEGEEIERKLREEAERLEADTVTVEPIPVPIADIADKQQPPTNRRQENN